MWVDNNLFQEPHNYTFNKDPTIRLIYSVGADESQSLSKQHIQCHIHYKFVTEKNCLNLPRATVLARMDAKEATNRYLAPLVAIILPADGHAVSRLLQVDVSHSYINMYSKISNISHTKPKRLNFPCFVMHLSLCNILKPGVKSRMKM